jgi:hypothetical protein
MMQILGKQALIEGKLVRIGRLDAEGYEFVEDPEATINCFRSLGTRVDLFTFIQKLSEPTPKYGYLVEHDNMAALSVSTFDHWMTKQIDFKVRNKVRKAEKKGVVIREVPYDDAFVRGISNIYNETPIRQGKRFWHYQKDLEDVRRMNGTFMSQSIFIGALLEDKLIGFVKLVTNEDRSQAGLMQIVSMMQHRDKAPTNALVAQAVRSCAERRIPHLWYANFSYGKKQTDSLAEFKRHNGFQKVEIPRYYVPLTPAGNVALRLGLHRRTAEWVPEPVIATYRRARSLWYARRFPGLENA